MIPLRKGGKDIFEIPINFQSHQFPERSGECSKYGVKSDKGKKLKKVISLHEIFIVVDIVLDEGSFVCTTLGANTYRKIKQLKMKVYCSNCILMHMVYYRMVYYRNLTEKVEDEDLV